MPTYQWAFSRRGFLNVNQIAKGNAHKVGSDTAVWLDIHQIRIASSVRIFLKPETKPSFCQCVKDNTPEKALHYQETLSSKH